MQACYSNPIPSKGESDQDGEWGGQLRNFCFHASSKLMKNVRCILELPVHL